MKEYFTNPGFVLLLMYFMHYLADWVVQTDKVAELKQKKSWEKFGNPDLYKNDYKTVLSEHAYTWSFMVMTPLLICNLHNAQWSLLTYFLLVLANTGLHYIIDDMKANEYKMSLKSDQLLHDMQILVSFFIYIIVGGALK